MADNENVFKRLSRLFRSGPVIKKKIVSVDTSVAVPSRGQSSAARIFQRSVTPTYNQITSNTFTIQERLGRYQDYCEMEMCLSYHTLIASPEYENGFVEIGKLAEECEKDPNKTFIVYAYDHEKNCIVPTLGKQARKTVNDHAWKVTFDDGQEIIGSFEHRLMLRDGTYCKLGELQPGMAMMPFYRRDLYAKKEDAETKGYRWIYTMSPEGHNGWQPEHALVAQFVNGRKLKETEVVHHINFQKHDNRPTNLMIMEDSEHRAYHAKIVNGKKWSVENSEWIEKFKKNHSKFMKENNPVKRHDITFGRILETCERVGFNIVRLQEALDADLSVIGRRLEEKGFKNFSTFAKAYQSDWKNGGWDNNGDKNPKFDKSITFETVCAAYQKGMTLKQLAAKMGYSTCKVEKRIQMKGYKNFKDFVAQYQNMKVVSVEYYGKIDLYDLTVDGYKNFATSTVVSHNTPELNACLNLYADETCSSDEKGRVLHIYSTNSRIRGMLEDLFYNNLNIEFNLRPWVRNLCKYGDAFLLNDVHPQMGVINAIPIPVNHIERVENFDPSDPFAVKFRWVDKNKELDNWEVTHMRLLGNDMFLPYGSSVIEGARRIWRQLILIEDAMLTYRITRSPERRVFYIDIGAIPPDEVGHYMEQVKTTLRGALVADQNTGRTDQRYSPLPVASYTQIPLLDGRTISIEQLANEYDAGKENWVYSVQDETAKVVPGKVVWCGKNYTAQKITRVHLDDGTWVDTAPEHPFVMRDGTKKRADELTVGEALMPLYRKRSSKKEGHRISDYDMVYNPYSEEYAFTHRLVGNEALSEQREQIRLCTDWEINNNLVVHHMDYNRLNNTPCNLLWIGNNDHFRMHAYFSEFARENIIRYNKSDLHSIRTIARNKRLGLAKKMGEKYNGTELHKSHNELRREAQNKSWKDNREERSKAMRWKLPACTIQKLAAAIRKLGKVKYDKVHAELMNDKEFFSELKELNKDFGRPAEKMTWGPWMALLEAEGLGKYTEFRQSILESGYKNHKVARVETIEQTTDVYCMTVVGPNGEEDRHNFAVETSNDKRGLSSGIYLGNSIEEDYFLPVRGTESGTRIDTLKGGENVGTVNDVEYIQKKLFAALQVPKAYLGFEEALGSKASLAQIDIRFSRTISMIQRTIISELNKLAMIHLAVAGYSDEDLVNFSLRLSNPSSVAQQQKLELIRSKFEIMGTAPDGLLSRDWLRKNVMGMTPEEIVQVEKEIIDDATSAAAREAASLGGGTTEEGLTQTAPELSEIPPAPETGGASPSGEVVTAGERRSDNLVLSHDDGPNEEEIPVRLSMKDDNAPIKVQNQLDRLLYNRKRRRHHGSNSHGMPDFSKMTGNDTPGMKDPADYSYLKSVAKIGKTVTENVERELEIDPFMTGDDPGLSQDFKEMLDRMKKKLNYQGGSKKVLAENAEEIDFESFNDENDN